MDANKSVTATFSPITAPSLPQSVIGTPGNGTAAINFSPPATTGGAAILLYGVSCSAVGQSSGSSSGASSPIMVAGLFNGVTYDCVISADNGFFSSSAVTVQVTPRTTLGAPTGLSAITGNAQATLSFTVPANGGATISGYTVTCTAAGNPTRTATGPGTSLIVTGMVNGVTYNCSVVATNSAGTSIASGTVMVTPVAIAFSNLVYSRKYHGAVVGDKSITLNQMAAFSAATIEPRAGSDGHRIVFVFSIPVSSVTSVRVVDAMGVAIPGAVAAPSFSNNELVVTLTGLPENIRVTVNAIGVNNALNVTTAVAFLLGDVSGNSRINATDIAAIKARVSQNVSTGNSFLFDLNLNGVISSADVSTVKARSGFVLP